MVKKTRGRPSSPAAEERAICEAVGKLIIGGCPPKRAFDLVAAIALERFDRGRDDTCNDAAGNRRPLAAARIKEIYEAHRASVFDYPEGPGDAGSHAHARRIWDWLERHVSPLKATPWKRPRGKPLTKAELAPWKSQGDASSLVDATAPRPHIGSTAPDDTPPESRGEK